jgi:hypothetical protein
LKPEIISKSFSPSAFNGFSALCFFICVRFVSTITELSGCHLHGTSLMFRQQHRQNVVLYLLKKGKERRGKALFVRRKEGNGVTKTQIVGCCRDDEILPGFHSKMK